MKAWKFDRDGGTHAHDFANTVSGRASGAPVDHLPRYEDLVELARQLEIVSAAGAAHLRRWGESHPEEAEKILRAAVELREALYGIFQAVAADRRPEAKDLSVLNAWLPRLRLGPSLEWEWGGGADAPDAFLAPIVRSAIEMLTEANRARLKACGSETCRWVFYDATKNASRRWCDMASCGNREKARRFRRHS